MILSLKNVKRALEITVTVLALAIVVIEKVEKWTAKAV
jgi:hypothetical protein